MIKHIEKGGAVGAKTQPWNPRIGVLALLICAMAGCGGSGGNAAMQQRAPQVLYKDLSTDAAMAQPSFYLEHAEALPAGGLRFYYFFATPAGTQPTLEVSEDSPLDAQLEVIGQDRYRVRIEVADAGGHARWPEQGAYGFQLRLAGNIAWDRSADYSGQIQERTVYAPNSRMPLYAANGDLLGGEAVPDTWLLNAFDVDATEQEVPLKSGSDLQPPSLTIGPNRGASVAATEIIMTGTVTDLGGSGVGTVAVTSNRQPGRSFAAAISGQGFTVTVPLAVGVNRLLFTARDHAGNESTRITKIRRTVQPVQIALTAPAGDMLTTQASITVKGSVTADPADSVVVSLNRRQKLPTATSTPGLYEFEFIAVGLKEGHNRLLAQAKALTSTASAEVDVVRDRTPPVLGVSQFERLAADAVSVTLTGTATDAVSGVASIDAATDRAPSTFYSGTIASDGVFTVEVPLTHLTAAITVRARDIAGNWSQKVVSIKRARLLLSIAEPAPGSRTTKSTVTVSGTVEIDPQDSGLRVIVGEYQQVPTPLSIPGRYSYSFAGVPLSPGRLNNIAVAAESAAGKTKAITSVFYDAPASDDHAGPVLSLRTPATGATVNDAYVMIAGEAADPAGVATVKIAGQAVALIGATPASVSFHENVAAPAADGPFSVVLSASDKLGNVTTQTLNLRHDASAPVIMVTDPVPAGEVLHSAGNPLELRGTIEDGDLAGFSIDDEPLQLLPGAHAGAYMFDARLTLPVGQDKTVELLAWDQAGNQTRKRYTARNEAQAAIEIISPRDGAVYSIGAGAENIPVVVRIVAAPAQASVLAHLGAHDVTLVRDGASYTGQMVAAGLAGTQQFSLKLMSATGDALASASSRFEIVDARTLPLAVERTEPANSAENVDINAPLAFYFNKPIDASKLSVQLFETVHGRLYGAGNPTEMVDINRDQELVGGAVSILPGNDAQAGTNKVAMFYPARDYAYGAAINLRVDYDGATLLRGAFSVRPAPTLVQGLVVNQFGQPLVGVEVQLAELKLSTFTNNDGAFDFGFGADAPQIAAGRYRLLVNPGMRSPLLGGTERWATLEAGRYNDMGVVRVAALDGDVPSIYLESGRGKVTLARGELILDLTHAQLLFANQRTAGAAHVQFVAPNQLSLPTTPGSMPNWAYATHPAGIVVSGQIGIEINPPPLNGSHAYLPADGICVLLVGADPAAKTLRPVGVARIQSRRIVSVGAVALGNLDYIGVRFLKGPPQDLLQQFAAGSITLEELRQRLEP